MKNKLTKLLLIPLIALFTLIPNSIVKADTGDTIIEGTIQPTVLSFSVSTNTSFAVNPNGNENAQFIAPDFTLSNNCNAPIKVEILKFTSDSGSDWFFTDVLPTKYSEEEWKKLDKSKSRTDIALALVPKTPAEWRSLSHSEPIYAKEVQDTSGSLTIGELDPNSSATFTLSGKHGNAFEGMIETKYYITFVLSLV